MIKYVRIYSTWYQSYVYRLTIAGQDAPNSYIYSFAFSYQDAIDNINAMRQISKNIRSAK